MKQQQQQETVWIIESSLRVFCCIRNEKHAKYKKSLKKIKSIVYEPRERVCCVQCTQYDKCGNTWLQQYSKWYFSQKRAKKKMKL